MAKSETNNTTNENNQFDYNYYSAVLAGATVAAGAIFACAMFVPGVNLIIETILYFPLGMMALIAFSFALAIPKETEMQIFILISLALFGAYVFVPFFSATFFGLMAGAVGALIASIIYNSLNTPKNDNTLSEDNVTKLPSSEYSLFKNNEFKSDSESDNDIPVIFQNA